MNENKFPRIFRDIITEEEGYYSKGVNFEIRKTIPDATDIPISDPCRWFKIEDVICVFVDMKNSTGLSASSHPRDTAAAYRLFTGTAVKFFHAVDAPYIDIKGDGVFALFNTDQAHKAIATAVTFKSFVVSNFIQRIKSKTSVDVGVRIGIDQKTVLVRKIGLKFVGDRTDRQNEVWAGKPVNMASKLASLANNNEIIVSERFYSRLSSEKAINSCGCENGIPGNSKKSLWTQLDLTHDSKFDFDTAYSLSSVWCDVHGAEYCEELLKI